jgi:ribose transport system permease protein
VLQLTLARTVFGRSLYIIGTNPRAAAVAGLPVKRILVATYVLCSVLAALGAIMMTARTGSGEPNLGGSLSLQAPAPWWAERALLAAAAGSAPRFLARCSSRSCQTA